MVDSQGEQYLVCQDYEDMQGYTDGALEEYGISVSSVLKHAEAAKRTVVVFDACRRNLQPTGRIMDMYSVGLALVVYACAANKVAFDGFLDGNGFLSHLIEV